MSDSTSTLSQSRPRCAQASVVSEDGIYKKLLDLTEKVATIESKQRKKDSQKQDKLLRKKNKLIKKQAAKIAELEKKLSKTISVSENENTDSDSSTPLYVQEEVETGEESQCESPSPKQRPKRPCTRGINYTDSAIYDEVEEEYVFDSSNESGGGGASSSASNSHLVVIDKIGKINSGKLCPIITKTLRDIGVTVELSSAILKKIGLHLKDAYENDYDKNPLLELIMINGLADHRMRYPIENLDWYMKKLRDISVSKGWIAVWVKMSKHGIST